MNILLNLQLFADANVQTTLLNTTGNDLSPEMKTFYSKDLIDTLGANLVHAQFGDDASLPAGGGKTIEWRKWTKFKKALTPLVEGVTPDGTPIDVGRLTKTVEEFGDYSTVSDILELTAIDNVIVETTSQHANNASLTLDTIVRNELVSGTQRIFADRIVGATTSTVSYRWLLDENAKLTPDIIARAAAKLKKQNAPKIDGSYVAIIHPSVAYDLLRNENFIDVNKYSNATAIFNGEIGKLYGVRFVESTEACIYKGADLSAASRTLTAAAYSASNSGAGVVNVTSGCGTTSTVLVTLDEVLVAADAARLVGTKVVMKDVDASADTYELVEIQGITAGATSYLHLKTAPTVTPEDGDIFYPSEGGREGKAAYACLFLGKGAYKKVKLDGKGVEVIVKAKGSAGTADPLNQRSTIGWKVAGFGAQIVIDEYIVRVECGSYYSNTDEAN